MPGPLGEMLGTAVQQADRDAYLDDAFDAQVTRGPSRASDEGASGYTVELDHLRRPVLSFTWDDGDRRAKITALPKPDRNDNRVRPWFAPSLEGRSALELARIELAYGRAVSLRGGRVGVQIDRPPKFFDDLKAGRDLIGGQLDLEVSDSVPVTLTVIEGSVTHSLTVEAVLVPAKPGFRHAVAGLRAGVMVSVDWLPGNPGRSELASRICPDGVSATELLGGLRFARHFPTADLIRVDAPELFDQPIVDHGATGAGDPEETVDVALILAQVAARVELLIGRTISLPGAFDSGDLYEAQFLNTLLDGDYEQTVPPEAWRRAVIAVVALSSGKTWE